MHRLDVPFDYKHDTLKFSGINNWKIINFEKIELHNECAVIMRDAAMLLLLRWQFRDAVRSAHSSSLRNRRQPSRGAGNNHRYARERSSFKRKLAWCLKIAINLCSLYKREPVNRFILFWGIALESTELGDLWSVRNEVCVSRQLLIVQRSCKKY